MRRLFAVNSVNACYGDVTSTIRAIPWNGSKIRHMKTFHGGREAKEFLISEIVAEARRQSVRCLHASPIHPRH
jgi:hypothetical protein